MRITININQFLQKKIPLNHTIQGDFDNIVSLVSGWQDSNLRPPAPKAGAITGLRYTP